MLQKLDDPIKDAYDHAAQYSQKAKKARGRQEREDWLALERRYLMLAQSLELNGRLLDLAAEAKRRRKVAELPKSLSG
jgi:hypothetical protein